MKEWIILALVGVFAFGALYVGVQVVLPPVVDETVIVVERPRMVLFERAFRGFVYVDPDAVEAVLGPGEVILDNGESRINASTQLIMRNTLLRINVAGTEAEAYCRLFPPCTD